MKTISIGAIDAPMGETFVFPVPSNYGGTIKNPLICVELESKTLAFDYDDVNVTWIKIATSKVFATGDEALLWLRHYDTGSNPAFSIFSNRLDAENDNDPLATCEPVDGTAGLYAFLDTNDGETVWGWIYTRDGISQPGTPSVFKGRAVGHFSIPTLKWQVGVSVHLNLQFYISGYTNAPTTDFSVLLYNMESPFAPDSLGEFLFDNRPHQPQGGFVIAEVMIQCIESLDEDTTKRFRSWMEVRPGSEELSQLIDIQPLAQESQITFTNDSAAFLSIEQSANDGGGTPLTFDFISMKAEYLSTPGVLS